MSLGLTFLNRVHDPVLETGELAAFERLEHRAETVHALLPYVQTARRCLHREANEATCLARVRTIGAPVIQVADIEGARSDADGRLRLSAALSRGVAREASA